MRAQLLSLGRRIVVIHHGDADGIIGAAFVARFLRDHGVTVHFTSLAEFQLKDLSRCRAAIEGQDAGVFIEAQGMPGEYAGLDATCVNIDHHPHPDTTPIRRMLNPRRFDIEPNPAAALVIFEMLRQDLPPQAAWLAALASIADRCEAAAAELIAAQAATLARREDLLDTFAAVQYASPWPERLAEMLVCLPGPDALLAVADVKARREGFRARIAAALAAARTRGRIVLAETEAGEYRIASPLANRLSAAHPDATVVVVETFPDLARISVRSHRPGVHVGDTLRRLADGIAGEPRPSVGAAGTAAVRGDGTGHEHAGSARVPRAAQGRFMAALEAELG